MQQKIVKQDQSALVATLMTMAIKIADLVSQSAALENATLCTSYENLKIEIEGQKNIQNLFLSEIFELGATGVVDEAILLLDKNIKAKMILDESVRFCIQQICLKSPIYFVPIMVPRNLNIEVIDHLTLLKMELAWARVNDMPFKNVVIDRKTIPMSFASDMSVEQIYMMHISEEGKSSHVNSNENLKNAFDQFHEDDQLVHLIILRPKLHSEISQQWNEDALRLWIESIEDIISGSFKASISVYQPTYFYDAIRYGTYITEKIKVINSIKNQIALKNYFPQELSMIITLHGDDRIKLRPAIQQVRVSINNHLGDFVAGRTIILTKWMPDRDVRKLLHEVFLELKIKNITQINQLINLNEDSHSPRFYSIGGWKLISESVQSNIPTYVN